LSLAAFSRNFLYTPIPEAEFLAQNNAVLPYVLPDLILLAEKDDVLVGFMFALPDVLQARRGAAPDTVILKTIAVHPSWSGMGLGGALIDLVRRSARQRPATHRMTLFAGWVRWCECHLRRRRNVCRRPRRNGFAREAPFPFGPDGADPRVRSSDGAGLGGSQLSRHRKDHNVVFLVLVGRFAHRDPRTGSA
jgi:GNAT superfamily N-acetyltransferase